MPLTASSFDSTGGGESEEDGGSSDQDKSGDQVVFMWQEGQHEAHYREAVSGAQVHRYPAPPCLTTPPLCIQASLSFGCCLLWGESNDLSLILCLSCACQVLGMHTGVQVLWLLA